jgi:hypothetical protein
MLALAIATSVALGTSAAQAICTTGVECIRERFAPDNTVRNNSIIDRTDWLGDRGRPQNPYLAGRNVAGQARSAGRYDSTIGTGGTGGVTGGFAADPLRAGETRPDVRYTPGTAIEPYVKGSRAPGGLGPQVGDASDATIAPRESSLYPTGEAGAPGTAAQVTARPGAATSAAPARRPQNTPQGAANLRNDGPRMPGANR